MAETNLRDQSLEAKAPFDRRPGPPKIIIDDDDHLARPTEAERPVHQRVLQSCRFLVALDLLHRRLPDVDNRQPFAMSPRDLLRQQAAQTRHQAPVHHLPPPPRWWCLGAVAAPSARASIGRPAAVPAAASPRPAGADIRSSRDPSQRTKAHNAWNPNLGDSLIAVNLSAALSMGYRSSLSDPEGSVERAPDLAPALRARSGSYPRVLSRFRAVEEPGDVAAACRAWQLPTHGA